MKKNIKLLIAVIFAFLSTGWITLVLGSELMNRQEEVFSQNESNTDIWEDYSESTSLTTELAAFPGAEGHGKYVTGGRGGKVIYVTRLADDSNPGSLRHAINQSGARIILFKVSGTIQLKSELRISRGDVTIAGQTAPGDGITLRDYNVRISANNVIIRFLRFRMGDVTNIQNDAIWGRNQRDIIIDHCSMSWATDELSSFYDNENFTMQWCILSEALRNSVHEKGIHGYGGIWGGKKATFHHNILAHNDSRNPRFCGSRYSNNPGAELVDFRNNTLFNWGANTVYGGEGGNYNLVNNYYKAGPASSNRTRILQPYADDGKNSQPQGVYGKFYIDGNVVAASTAISNNNWAGVTRHSSLPANVTFNDLRSDAAFDSGEITTHSAETGHEKVIAYAGASLKRDAVDLRIVQEVETGNVTFKTGGNGSVNGMIDTQSAVGGWPELQTAEAPIDSDNDGMPDDWEIANGLNPYDSSDAQLISVDGNYPNVEAYINSLVVEITENQLITSTPPVVEKIIDEPVFRVNPSGGNLIIEHQSRIQLVQVFSVNGALLKTVPVSDFRAEINIIEKGILLVRIIDENRQAYTKKIVNH